MKGGGEVDHLAQLFGGDTHLECRFGMGLQLGERLHRGEGDAGDHLALFQGQVARLEDLAEDELLQNIHHFRVRTLSGQGFAAEQRVVILLADFDSIHIVCSLCHRGQASCQHEDD